MMPLAPGRLSMTTACLVFSSICLPIRRAVMSPEPPGPNGTMILIGRDGYWAACAGTGANAAPMSARTERRLVLFLFILGSVRGGGGAGGPGGAGQPPKFFFFF